MDVLIVTPAPAGSRAGNRVAATRRARLLRRQGHRVSVSTSFNGQRADVLIALHAVKSAGAVLAFRKRFPRRPIVVVLTGTDLYGGLSTSERGVRAVEHADRLMVLQELALRRLPRRWRAKSVVIRQSVESALRWHPSVGRFEVCVLGHLRSVKDPFRAAMAVRRIEPERAIRVTQIGAPLTEAMGRRAEREARSNDRYRYLGEWPRWRALRYLARSHVMVLSSRIEGAPNALAEAVVIGVPVIATRIDAVVDLLGSDYPGLYTPGSTEELGACLNDVSRSESFLRALHRRTVAARKLLQPGREGRALAALLKGLS